MNGSFYEQLGGVAGLFEQWGACERTVVACALARRVPWPGLRLLQRAVEAALDQARHLEDDRLEREANDEVYLATLLAPDDDEDCEARLQKAVSLVPLIHGDNRRAVCAAVCGAGGLAQRAVEAPRRARPDLVRHLICYLLVHPAHTAADQRTLTQWLRYLESHMGGRTIDSPWPSIDANIWGSTSQFRRTVGKNVFRAVLDPPERFDSQESFSKNGRDVDISIESERLAFDATISQPKSQRSNSLTPPMTVMSSSAENLSEPFQKPRSFSLSSETSAGLRARLPLYTAGSETRLDELRSHKSQEAGMSTVAAWLKALRLHKYVWLFTNISYQQMIDMDDEYLEKLGVTKGARHKILLSISKLSERHNILRGIEAELTGAGSQGSGQGSQRSPGAGAVGRALERLRSVMLSPMPPDCDLPVEIVRLLHIASDVVSSEAVDVPAADSDAVDPLSLHCWLVEKALHHESFRRARLAEALRSLRHRLPPPLFYRHVGGTPAHRRGPKPRWRMSHTMKPRGSWSGPASGPTVPRGKSNSYPPFPPVPSIASLTSLSTPNRILDDYSNLDALCLQMTEQAIN